MKFKIYEDSANYTAQVIKLPATRAVPGLDNLVEVDVFGNSVLVGKDSDPNELYLFFPSGTQLSEHFLKANNLYRDAQLNVDNGVKGFFETHGRVKAIKFKGIISSGFVIPLQSSLDAVEKTWHKYLDEHLLKLGDSFNEINGIEICRKYVIPVNTPPGEKGEKATRLNAKMASLLIPNQFRFHQDTSHFANNAFRLKTNDIIVITDKWHGSSAILSKTLIKKRLTRWQKLLNFLGGQVSDKAYGYIYSSGKPKSDLPKGIESEWITNAPNYYSNNIWKRAFDDNKEKIEDGISLFGELVGYTESGQFIQKGYDYGCQITDDPISGFPHVGQYKFAVYRITYTKPTGEVIEFSWQQVKDYCAKYDMLHGWEFFFGTVKEFLALAMPNFPDNSTPPIDKPGEAILQVLQESGLISKKCIWCTTDVPSEGVVVRIDGHQKFNAYKFKTKLFLKKESDDLDKGENNIEDEQ